jgi:hypothetical protein
MSRPTAALAFAFLICAAFSFGSSEAQAAKLKPGQYKLSNGEQLCISKGREWYAKKWAFGRGYWGYQSGSLILTGHSDEGTGVGLISAVKTGLPRSYVYIRWTGRGDKNPTVIAADELKRVKDKCTFDAPRQPSVPSAPETQVDGSLDKGKNKVSPGQYYFYSENDGRCLTKKGKWYPVRIDDRDWGGWWGSANKSYYLYGNESWGGYVFSIMINDNGKYSYIDALWSDTSFAPTTYARKLTYDGSKCEPKSP